MIDRMVRNAKIEKTAGRVWNAKIDKLLCRTKSAQTARPQISCALVGLMYVRKDTTNKKGGVKITSRLLYVSMMKHPKQTSERAKKVDGTGTKTQL